MTLTHDFLTDYTNFVFAGLMEAVIFTILAAGILGVRIKSILKRTAAIIPLLFVAPAIEILASSYFTATCLCILTSFACMMIIFRQSPLKCLYTYSMAYIMSTIINILLLLIITPIINNNFTTVHSFIIGGFTIAAGIILYLTGILEKLYNAVVIKSDIMRSLLILLFTACLLMTAYRRLAIDDFMDTLLLITFALIIVIVLYAGIYKGAKELDESKRQLQSYKQYLPIVEDLIDQVRMRQHDFGNELQAIRMLPVVHSDYESLAAALNDEMENAECKSTIRNIHLLNINMKLIAGFLFSCSHTAMDKGLELRLDIRNTHLVSDMPEFELLDVLSILADNAFEASAKGDSVCISIDSDGAKTTIETLNPGPVLTADMRRDFFVKGYSTKPKKDGNISRGIGLYKLKQLVGKYDDAITLENQTSDGRTYIHFSVEV